MPHRLRTTDYRKSLARTVRLPRPLARSILRDYRCLSIVGIFRSYRGARSGSTQRADNGTQRGANHNAYWAGDHSTNRSSSRHTGH